MKKWIAAAAAAAIATTATAQTFSEGLRYCEGTVPYKNTVLVSNFGTEALNPLNTEGKGYIMAIEGDEVRPVISAQGGWLSAPKGMAVVGHHLFVADVGKVVVFNLRKPKEAPKVIKLGDEDLFANDVATMGSLVLVSVTNTGRIYAIDATDIDNLGKASVVGRVPGANGMALGDGYLYVASYDPGEKPGPENVIYVCSVGSGSLTFRPLIKGLAPGQYDGLVLSEDGDRIYFTNWRGPNGGVVSSYKLDGSEPVRTIDFGVQFQGPADISIADGQIYIPDLPASKVYRFQL